MEIIRQEIQKYKEKYCRTYQIESKNTPGKFYDVDVWDTGKIECNCIAGLMGQECSHKKELKTKLSQ
ncbi:MAG: hypothetical protein ACOC5T_07160 [Elusimicrobiota bacterium]